MRIFPIFLQAVSDPDEEPVFFAVLIDMQNQSEDSGLPSQTATPGES